jgi:hypothetical protein
MTKDEERWEDRMDGGECEIAHLICKRRFVHWRRLRVGGHCPDDVFAQVGLADLERAIASAALSPAITRSGWLPREIHCTHFEVTLHAQTSEVVHSYPPRFRPLEHPDGPSASQLLGDSEPIGSDCPV